MAFTKVVGPGIHTQSNINSHNIHSTGIITATRFDGPFTNLNVTGVTTFTGDANFGGKMHSNTLMGKPSFNTIDL